MVNVRELYEEFPFPYRGNHDNLLDRYVFPSVPGTPKTILDAGCGTGNLAVEMARHFPSSRLTAIDFSNASLARAQSLAEEAKVSNLSFRRQDLMEEFPIELRENPFDFVMSIGVLMITPDPEVCLRHLRQVTATGAPFLVLL